MKRKTKQKPQIVVRHGLWVNPDGTPMSLAQMFRESEA